MSRGFSEDWRSTDLSENKEKHTKFPPGLSFPECPFYALDGHQLPSQDGRVVIVVRVRREGPGLVS